jgi:ammonium transporter Rh
MAIVIGMLAGGISTFGFAIIQHRQQKWMKIIDTCGVTNLHGIPGLVGGIAVLPIVKTMNIGGHITGIGITIAVAFISGLLVGKVLPLMGRKKEAYEDAEEFLDAED